MKMREMNIKPLRCEVLRQQLWEIQFAEDPAKHVAKLARVLEEIIDMIDPLPGAPKEEV
jgi:hypothetical protein